jgi:DNA-binding response OmpR family regulator
LLTGVRILIVEEEFLIAFDIQRILESAKATQTVFARSAEEALRLGQALAGFQLAIIEMQPGNPSFIALYNALHAQNVAVVVSTSNSSYRRKLPGIETAHVVSKPFSEAELLDRCSAALALPIR